MWAKGLGFGLWFGVWVLSSGFIRFRMGSGFACRDFCPQYLCGRVCKLPVMVCKQLCRR